MPEEMSIEEYHAYLEQQTRKPSKYGNRRITIDGESYDSQAEYARWWQLQQLQRQVRIPLTVQGVEIGVYVADFVYFEGDRKVIEDVKSPMSRTPVYRLKKRHVLAQYGIAITEVEG